MAVPPLTELDLLHRNMCYALADPKRLQIMYALAEGPLHVNGIMEMLGLPQPTISRHLNILKQRGLVTGTRDGNRIIYELSDERLMGVLETLRAIMADLLKAQADTAIVSPPESEDVQ
jgi:DNA-binding transcriptional ArsR family regulator